MPTTIYKYQRVLPNTQDDQVLYFQNNINDDGYGATELGEIDGWHYVAVPDDVTLPAQWPEIQWQAVDLTPELKATIKQLRPFLLIKELQQATIRARYSQEQEFRISRISVGNLLGLRDMQPSERQEAIDFGNFIESVIHQGKLSKQKLGITD